MKLRYRYTHRMGIMKHIPHYVRDHRGFGSTLKKDMAAVRKHIGSHDGVSLSYLGSSDYILWQWGTNKPLPKAKPKYPFNDCFSPS